MAYLFARFIIHNGFEWRWWLTGKETPQKRCAYFKQQMSQNSLGFSIFFNNQWYNGADG